MLCLLLMAAAQRGENKHVCSSYGSLHFSRSLLACPLPTRGLANSAHSEMQRDSRYSQQDTQQVEEPEASPDEGSQGHRVAGGTMWLPSSRPGLQWRTQGRWTGHRLALRVVRGSEFPFA